MESLTPKSFTGPSSFSYSYYYINEKAQGDKPTLFFLHGWPDSARLWDKIISLLKPLDLPIVVPDLLGYGGSSKPTKASSYNSKSMATDLAALLDSENISTVIPIGHDWGSFMAQRFYLWYPTRCAGVILVNVAYSPPDQQNAFDLQANLKMMESLIGYPNFAYWELFTADDGPVVLESHLESLWTGLHGAPEGLMKDLFCTRGAMRDYLNTNKTLPLRPYAEDTKLRESFITRLRKDGLTGPLQWYRAVAENVQFEVEKEIPSERFRIEKPVLFIGCKQDVVCLIGLIQIPIDGGLLPQLTMEEIDCGHWSPLEEPETIARHISAFLTANFLK